LQLRVIVIGFVLLLFAITNDNPVDYVYFGNTNTCELHFLLSLQ